MKGRHSKVMSSVRQLQFHGGDGSFPIRSLEVILHLGINRRNILFGFHVVCMMYNEESGVTPQATTIVENQPRR